MKPTNDPARHRRMGRRDAGLKIRFLALCGSCNVSASGSNLNPVGFVWSLAKRFRSQMKLKLIQPPVWQLARAASLEENYPVSGGRGSMCQKPPRSDGPAPHSGVDCVSKFPSRGPTRQWHVALETAG